MLSACIAFSLFFAFGFTVTAQVVTIPTTPQVGSSNPVTAEPLVPRPHTQPCVVSLFQNQAFADFNAKSFSYTPPANCPGPWSKVVFTADFTVTAGRQFDRTAQFYLGHVNLYYGTTAEPRSTLSPSWHVEREVTDLASLFKNAQTGEADLGNFIGVDNGVTYNGIIYANAALEFYPISFIDPAPPTPSVVVPLPDAAGGAATLNTTSSQLTQQVNLPTNMEKIYLDVIAQSQSNDEFWYTCDPSDIAAELQNCGNTGFRETEISIDGTPAGVAPVYPWIYTGGFDPFLWEPLPGVQTLDFKPYRVDLSPFAGILSNGQPHTVAISVLNADSYFLVSATLLAFTDPRSTQITGGILHNDLASSPTPTVSENIHTDSSGNITGTVSVGSARKYTISGYIETAHGRVTSTVEQNLSFLNSQQFNITSSVYTQSITQSTTADSKSTSQEGFFSYTTEQHFSYPFTLSYTFTFNSDGTSSLATTSSQQYLSKERQSLNNLPLYLKNINEKVNSNDTRNFNAAGQSAGNNGTANASYIGRDSLSRCYSRTLTAAGNKLTSVVDNQECSKEGFPW